MAAQSPLINDNPSIHLRYTFFLGFTAALGGLLFGFDIAIITGAGPFIARAFALSDLSLGWAYSSLLFGCVLGSLAIGKLSDRFGRRAPLMFVAILFGATSIATGLATTFNGFVTARFLGGLAVGGVSLLSPLYVAEVSPPSIRGRMGALYQLSIILGIVGSYGINYGLRGFGPDNWRWMFFSGVAPSALFLVLIALAPETPRFLVMCGKPHAALVVLERINGSRNAQQELGAIQASVDRKTPSWKALLRPGVRRALLVSSLLAVLIHASGINTVIDYAPVIFQSAGWKVDAALASTLVVGFTELLFTLVSIWAIDKYGRKPLYIIGSAGMALALMALVAAVLTGHFEGWTVLILILTYLAFFAACIGPVFWTLMPEIFPNDVRGVAMTVPVITQWIANAVVVLLFPYVFHKMGKAPTFGFLMLMSIAQAVFTWLWVPETKNKQLEEIEQFWINPKHAALAEPHVS